MSLLTLTCALSSETIVACVATRVVIYCVENFAFLWAPSLVHETNLITDDRFSRIYYKFVVFS